MSWVERGVLVVATEVVVGATVVVVVDVVVVGPTPPDLGGSHG